MARKDSNKKMNSNKYEDKLIDKLNIEFGLKKPTNQNNKKKGKGNKNDKEI